MKESIPFVQGHQIITMESHAQAIRNRLGFMERERFTERFWQKDGQLWGFDKDDPKATQTMGWIEIAQTMQGKIPELRAFASEITAAGFERAVLAGMGGSSLAPLVLSEVLGKEAQGIPVEVLDSTDPETVLRIQHGGPLEKTLFVIASKSGTTAEPTAFDEYFFDQMSKVKGNPGENFAVITDPGSELEKSAKEKNYRHTFLNFADIGGRFSALSYFGLVPAALMGVDLDKLLQRAVDVVNENKGKPVSHSPAFVLGAALGTLQTLQVDKLTFWLPKRLESLGLWLEQLLAESTGKEGKGILPVAGETPGSPSEYGEDRVFAYLRPKGEDCTYLDALISPLRDGGVPVVEILMRDDYDLAREFMHWELATAAAGSAIGIDPFDQPNVQESKDVTKQFIAEVEERGSLPNPRPSAEVDDLTVYGDVKGSDISELLFGFLEQAQPGDYVALQAYLTESEAMTDALTLLQQHIRDCTKLATTKGYGPRFLHSTGQFHKGGPNTGHFIQLSENDNEDVPLPGRKYSFGTFRNAQILGDFETLKKHGRRVIRIHLGDDPLGGVRKLLRAVESRPAVNLA